MGTDEASGTSDEDVTVETVRWEFEDGEEPKLTKAPWQIWHAQCWKQSKFSETLSSSHVMAKIGM